MEKRDLKVFMREAQGNVHVAGPATFAGADGKPIMLEIKVLGHGEIQHINDMYTMRTMATDTRGNPYIQNGQVAFKVENDTKRATGHILAEALVYPNLKDDELMKYYNCLDITEMASKVFSRTDEFAHVNRVVMAALGLSREADNADTKQALDDAKN